MKGQALNISVHHRIIPIMHKVIEFSLFINTVYRRPVSNYLGLLSEISEECEIPDCCDVTQIQKDDYSLW